MGWIERTVEERLANAAAAGELDVPAWRGRPLPDLDRPREPGWWADGFVRRERSLDRRELAVAAARRARAGFWRAADLTELHERVAAANAAIVRANAEMVPSDRLRPFDPADIESRWSDHHVPGT